MSSTTNNREELELSLRARELVEDASREVGHRVNNKGADGLTRIGDGLDRAAGFIEEKSPSQNEEQVQAVTSRIHDAATYLKESDPKSMVRDIDRGVHHHPYRAMVIALGAGWIVGKLMKS